MIVTRGKLTVDQAARIATVALCVECGETTTVLTTRDHAAIDHRCPTRVSGPVWTVTERPSPAARRALKAS